MYTVKQGGDIHRGDLVAISNSNDFCIGIYFVKKAKQFKKAYPRKLEALPVIELNNPKNL